MKSLHVGATSRLAGFVVAVLLLPVPEVVTARQVRDSLALRFYYAQNVTDTVLMWEDNEAVFARLDSLRSEAFSFDSVRIEGWASPESPVQYNMSISERRADNLRQLLERRYGLPDSIFSVVGRGEEWRPVSEYLDGTADLDIAPRRYSLQQIVAGQHDLDARERAIRSIGGGIPYRRLFEDVYPMCRYAEAVVSYSRIAEEPQQLEEDLSEAGDTLVKAVPVPDRSTAADTLVRDWKLALRTNLLLPALNAGVMVPVGKHLTLGADWYYPWIWPSAENRWCIELLGLGLEGRWWFRDGTSPYRRASGHSVGLGLMAGYYDFERNYNGRQGEYACAALDWQYAFPLRQGRWRLSLGFGFGFLLTQYREYEVHAPGERLFRVGGWSKRQRYFGPLRADVTLAIPLWYDKKL